MSQRERLPTDILGLLSGTVAFPGTAGSSLPDLAELIRKPEGFPPPSLGKKALGSGKVFGARAGVSLTLPWLSL